MADELSNPNPEQNANVQPDSQKVAAARVKTYGDGEEGEAEAKHSLAQIQHINDALAKREQWTLVFNGMSYSRSYVYNQQKAINYAPPRDPKDDREVSLGIVHEKIIGFVAIFLKYMFRRRIKCYDEDGKLVEGMGDVYDLAIEFSQRAEQFAKKVALIYWEVFTQGNAFVLEDWDVRTIIEQDAYSKDKDGQEVKVSADSMDYSYEFIEGLTYKPGKTIQKRKAVSRVLDGRMVIFDNPENVDVQGQAVTIEEDISRSDAEQLYGTLKRWAAVPKEKVEIDLVVPEKVTLFNASRLSKPSNRVIVHRRYDPVNNRFNLWLNGVMMLPRTTTMTIFYPRGNTPLSNVPGERLSGSIYSRSIPAKTKFNADFVDWALKQLALKFEQGVVPAILAKGRYTLTRQIFRAGQVTHGVQKSDYEKADPDNKGVTTQEANFFSMLKEIVEAQTLNATASGELDPQATATEIAITDQNQRDKLAFLLDGLVAGFMDMALRRAETIESKYTIKQKETVVDGKTVSVYQNFTVSLGGSTHEVVFDDAIGDPTYNHAAKQNELFQKAELNKRKGKNTEYYLADPVQLRRGAYLLDIEIIPERVKEIELQMAAMWEEFTNLINTFGAGVNMQELQQIYLQTRGRPASVFNSEEEMKLKQIEAAQNGMEQGGQGAPAIKTGTAGATAPGFRPRISNNKGGRQRPAMLAR
jgi:hypothetical protein